jgi:hypothetical protein
MLDAAPRCAAVGCRNRTSSSSVSSLPSPRRRASHHTGPAWGTAPRRAVACRRHERVAPRENRGRVYLHPCDQQDDPMAGFPSVEQFPLRVRLHPPRDIWPPTMLGRLGARPLDAQQLAVATGRVALRYRPRRLPDSWPPTMLGWAGARPLDAHFSLMARTSSSAASSSPSLGRLAAHHAGLAWGTAPRRAVARLLHGRGSSVSSFCLRDD